MTQIDKHKYNYIPLPEPIPITEQQWPDGTLPIVAIGTLAYNHEPYIRDYIEGVLMQKTTFPVIICVFEDCSTDKTAEILKEYAEKHPQLFHLFCQEENTYGKPFRKERAKPYLDKRNEAKYNALCEADDYWTDSLKLQKQVDFMESNPEVVVTVGGFEIYKEGKLIEQVIRRLKPNAPNLNGYYFNLRDTQSAWITKTLTLMFRTSAHDLNIAQKYNFFRDIHLNYELLKKGKGFYFTEVFGVYVQHPGGVHSAGDIRQKKDTHYKIFSELYHVNKDAYTRRILNRYSMKLLNDKLYSKSEEKNSINIFSLFCNSMGLIRNYKDFGFFILAFLPKNIGSELLKKIKFRKL